MKYITFDNNQLLESLRAPASERALLKFIPLNRLDEVRAELRKVYPNCQFYTKFRGPRNETCTGKNGHCYKANAIYASIYFKSRNRKYLSGVRKIGDVPRRW